MDNQIIFNVFKNTIIEQNKLLLKIIAQKYNKDYDELITKYLIPENFLPVIEVSKNNNK
jgi:hypothetical protein